MREAPPLRAEGSGVGVGDSCDDVESGCQGERGVSRGAGGEQRVVEALKGGEDAAVPVRLSGQGGRGAQQRLCICLGDVSPHRYPLGALRDETSFGQKAEGDGR